MFTPVQHAAQEQGMHRVCATSKARCVREEIRPITSAERVKSIKGVTSLCPTPARVSASLAYPQHTANWAHREAIFACQNAQAAAAGAEIKSAQAQITAVVAAVE